MLGTMQMHNITICCYFYVLNCQQLPVEANIIPSVWPNASCFRCTSANYEQMKAKYTHVKRKIGKEKQIIKNDT
jgi:hypothetical protein